MKALGEHLFLTLYVLLRRHNMVTGADSENIVQLRSMKGQSSGQHNCLFPRLIPHYQNNDRSASKKMYCFSPLLSHWMIELISSFFCSHFSYGSVSLTTSWLTLNRILRLKILKILQNTVWDWGILSMQWSNVKYITNALAFVETHSGMIRRIWTDISSTRDKPSPNSIGKSSWFSEVFLAFLLFATVSTWVRN